MAIEREATRLGGDLAAGTADFDGRAADAITGRR
jgi:hypothetical protein